MVQRVKRKIARDQHAEGPDNKSASVTTQLLVARDLLRFQPEILKNENRFVEADDDDPGEERTREHSEPG